MIIFITFMIKYGFDFNDKERNLEITNNIKLVYSKAHSFYTYEDKVIFYDGINQYRCTKEDNSVYSNYNYDYVKNGNYLQPINKMFNNKSIIFTDEDDELAVYDMNTKNMYFIDVDRVGNNIYYEIDEMYTLEKIEIGESK